MYHFSKKEIKDIILSLHLIEDETLDDEKKINRLYAISNKVEDNYREFKIKKRTGGFRTISAPSRTLKNIQRNILKNYLYQFKPSKYVTSYREGTSIRDNASPHVGKKIILKLDIEDFFGSVDFIKVYSRIFGNDKLVKQVGVLLASLTTYYGVLPQGAPTSPYISNLILKDFDEKIGAYAEARNIAYTRYSDDMTFSGDFDVSKLIRIVRHELGREGLTLNDDKVHVVGRHSSQLVTGICVNEKAQVAKSYRKAIRQAVYYIDKFGLDDHLKKINCSLSRDSYILSLLGKINFVLSIDQNNKEFVAYRKKIKDLL